jgi:hypothetical protein
MRGTATRLGMGVEKARVQRNTHALFLAALEERERAKRVRGAALDEGVGRARRPPGPATTGRRRPLRS